MFSPHSYPTLPIVMPTGRAMGAAEERRTAMNRLYLSGSAEPHLYARASQAMIIPALVGAWHRTEVR